MGLRHYGFRKIYGVASLWFSKNLWGWGTIILLHT